MSKTWYEYTRFTKSPETATKILADRETEHFLFHKRNGRQCRDKKRTSYSRWVDSIEELERLIAEREESEDKVRARARVKDAAEELLEALEEFINYDAEKEGDVSLIDCQRIWGRAAAAIAKAKGEQQ